MSLSDIAWVGWAILAGVASGIALALILLMFI